MHDAKVDRIGPILVGGLVGGVASGIPCLNCLNVLCCSLYIVGGVVAGMMFARAAAQVNVYPSAGQGFLTGGLAGVVAGVIGGLLGTVTQLLLGTLGMQSDPSEALRQVPDLDPEIAEQLDQILTMMAGPPTLGRIVFGLLVGAALGFIFSGIGGAIGTAISRKPPIEAPSVPPTPPPPPPATGV